MNYVEFKRMLCIIFPAFLAVMEGSSDISFLESINFLKCSGVYVEKAAPLNDKPDLSKVVNFSGHMERLYF